MFNTNVCKINACLRMCVCASFIYVKYAQLISYMDMEIVFKSVSNKKNGFVHSKKKLIKMPKKRNILHFTENLWVDFDLI